MYVGVSLRFMGQELNNGSSQVCLRDIGEQPSQSLFTPDTAEGLALVCATTNPSCCRVVDGASGGVGDWTLNGIVAEGTQITPLPLIYRNRGTGLVRLNVQTGAVVTGQFCCTIPDNSNITRTLCVDVTLGELTNGVLQCIDNTLSFCSDELVCNPALITTENTAHTTNNPTHSTTQSVTQAVSTAILLQPATTNATNG